jgi:hypothetical protein
MFCVTESFSAGRAKSEMPAMTNAHFMTGAQKCTVLRPTGLFHMRLTHGSLASEPAAVLWKRRPAGGCCILGRKKVRARKAGRAARKKVDGDITAGSVWVVLGEYEAFFFRWVCRSLPKEVGKAALGSREAEVLRSSDTKGGGRKAVRIQDGGTANG